MSAQAYRAPVDKGNLSEGAVPSPNGAGGAVQTTEKTALDRGETRWDRAPPVSCQFMVSSWKSLSRNSVRHASTTCGS